MIRAASAASFVWSTLVVPAVLWAQAPATRGYLADSALAFLRPLIGSWQPLELPDSLRRLTPPIVAHQYRWAVGTHAIALRENLRLGQDETAELQGLVYWNPATERVEFVAVAGHQAGAGRLFKGEYAGLADGAIERIYDVFYRSAADMPGEQFGGSRRRYREVYRLVTPDSIAATLEWFHDGAWRGFGAFARHGFVRLRTR